MASLSSKKTATSNNKTLKELHLISLSINSLVVLLLFVFKRPASKLPYIILSLPALFCQYTLEKSGRPKYAIDETTGFTRLARAGDDIKGQGLFEYMFDCIYVTWFIDILMILFGTNYVWWLYLIIPGYCGYKIAFIAKSFFGSKLSTSTVDSPETTKASGKSKRQTKMEARREKGQVQYRRG